MSTDPGLVDLSSTTALREAFGSAPDPTPDHLVGEFKGEYVGPLWLRTVVPVVMRLGRMPGWHGKRFAVVHVNGDRSSGGEYGKVGWAEDTLYFPATGEFQAVEGSGGMTRDGRTVFIRQGVQYEAPEAEVVPEYAAYDVATGESTPLPWMQEFVSTPAMPNYPFDTFRQASADGQLVVNHGSVRSVASGEATDIGALLQDGGYQPSTGDGPLRISGDGSVVLANVVGPDPLAESSNRVVAVSGWAAN